MGLTDWAYSASHWTKIKEINTNFLSYISFLGENTIHSLLEKVTVTGTFVFKTS